MNEITWLVTAFKSPEPDFISLFCILHDVSFLLVSRSRVVITSWDTAKGMAVTTRVSLELISIFFIS